MLQIRKRLNGGLLFGVKFRVLWIGRVKTRRDDLVILGDIRMSKHIHTHTHILRHC